MITTITEITETTGTSTTKTGIIIQDTAIKTIITRTTTITTRKGNIKITKVTTWRDNNQTTSITDREVVKVTKCSTKGDPMVIVSNKISKFKRILNTCLTNNQLWNSPTTCKSNFKNHNPPCNPRPSQSKNPKKKRYFKKSVLTISKNSLTSSKAQTKNCPNWRFAMISKNALWWSENFISWLTFKSTMSWFGGENARGSSRLIFKMMACYSLHILTRFPSKFSISFLKN